MARTASNDVPFTASIVVMFAVRPPGVPAKAIDAEPDTAAAQLPMALTARAALPFPDNATLVVPRAVPFDRLSVTCAVVGAFMVLRTPSGKAVAWTVVWVALAVLFGAGVYAFMGREAGLAYFADYLIEQALSVDNIFCASLWKTNRSPASIARTNTLNPTHSHV